MDSFIPWVGGKKLLRKEIVKRFPEDFKKICGGVWRCGMGIVFTGTHRRKGIL